MGDSIFEHQSEVLMAEAATVNSPPHYHEEDLDDVGCNADLYAFKQDTFQGGSNHERSQQATYPYFFQPLSLDYSKSWPRNWDVIFMGRHSTSITLLLQYTVPK